MTAGDEGRGTAGRTVDGESEISATPKWRPEGEKAAFGGEQSRRSSPSQPVKEHRSPDSISQEEPSGR